MLGKLNSINVSTNFWIIIGTLTVLVFAYIFYLEYHITSKESSIVSTRFRVLDQFGDNINAKINSYQSNANQMGSKILLDAEKEANDPNSEYYEDYLRYEDSRKLQKEYVLDLILWDYFVYGKTEKLSSYLNKDLEASGIKLDLGQGKYKILPDNHGDKTFLKKETDSYYYFEPIAIKSSDYLGDSLIDTVFVRTKYSNLIHGLQRNDVFDGFFVLNNNEIVYSTLQSDLLLGTGKNGMALGNTENENKQIEALLQQEELLIPSQNEALIGHIYSGEFLDITISNKAYKLFFKPVHINDQDWFLCGLMDASNFNAAKRSISPWVIILLSLMLILILLGLPLIKLKVISKTEHLDTSTISNSALSILVGSAVITLFFLFVTQNIANLQTTDKRLQEFSQSIDITLNDEIKAAFEQLEDYDSVHYAFQLNYKEKYPSWPVVTDILNDSIDSVVYPSAYKFADYLYWINNKGKQSAYVTPFYEVGTLTDLKNRDYYKKKDEWFLPSDNTKKFRLESIVSITSGNHKVALSTTSNVEGNPVIALSSRFYSIIDPIIPRNYGYCIIDESGMVWFHSNKNRNLMENFISECNDNGLLKAAIYNRTSKPIYVTYYNHPHRVYIQPIDKLPLYLVTFYNRKADTSFHAQVFTLTLFMLGGFFLFLFIQIIILMAMERQLQWKLSKNLIMKITRPMIHLKNHYKFLVWIYVIVAFVTGFLLSRSDNLQSIIIVYSLEIIIFTFSYRVLNHNQVKVKRRMWFTIINMVILFFMDMVLLSQLGKSGVLYILLFQGILIFSLELAYKLFKNRLENYNINFNAAFIRNYVLFLIAISIVFAIIPTFKFYEIGYNIESDIRLRHNQIDLMKQKEKRNMTWNKYYASQIEQTVSSRNVLNERKENGIYTRFLNDLKFSSKPIVPVLRDEGKYTHSIFDSLVVFLRPFYDDEVLENKYLIFSSQKNSNKNWINYDNNRLVLKYLSQSETPTFDTLTTNRIVGQLDGLNFLAPFHGKAFKGLKGNVFNLIFWLVMIFILYILYHLIRFGIRNIYSLDIVQNYSHESFGETIRHQMLANKDIFIVRQSVKDETTMVKDGLMKDVYLDWSDEKIIENATAIINECIRSKKSTAKKSEIITTITNSNQEVSGELNKSVTVLIDHFEWRFEDPELFKQKINLMWTILNRDNIRLIIVSQIHPDKIIEYYRGIVEKTTSTDETSSGEHDHAQSLKNLNEFTQLIANIIIDYLPTRFNYSWEDEDKSCKRSKSKMTYPGLINSELGASDYLHQFKNALTKYYETYCIPREIENPEELIITKINSLVDGYYEDLFNSCNDEEKYVLFDLAEDLIMNQKNATAIFSLLQKGLFIKKCDKINFMNISFRRYVMSRLSEDDTSALKVKMGKETGTWQGYKFTLILVIVGLFIFIAMANQDFLDNLNQLFIAIGGGIAVITGILGLLSRKNTESS